jgi:hypothetical protein
LFTTTIPANVLTRLSERRWITDDGRRSDDGDTDGEKVDNHGLKYDLSRTTSLLIRGSRNHQGHCWRNPPDGATMSDWQTWQETA